MIMEEIFSHMDGKFAVTLTDSTMMWIVHCAMNRAQEKMKTKKGVIERLNEISKFYELAVLQLEGCLSFVQAENERNSFLDTNHQQVLFELREIKDRLQRRLEESEMAISQKDREMAERLGNEFEQIQQQPLMELQEGDGGASKNHDSDGHGGASSCEKMKICADQKILNIYKTAEPNGTMQICEVPRSGIDTKKVEELGCDIDILKQTLDVAFEKIQNAIIFVGEMGPKEQHWKLKTEKEIQSILVRSYMREFQENVQSEVKMQGMQVLRNWWDHWPQLMDEVRSLRHELGLFITQNEFHSEDYSNSSVPFSQEKVSQQMVGKPASEQSGDVKLPDEDEESTEDGRNFVAKMVQKHQSIIRRKIEELNTSKHGLLLQEKKIFPTKKEKNMKDTMQNIAARLDNLITWNSSVRELLFGRQVSDDDEEKNDCTTEIAWENMKRISSSRNEEQENKDVLNKDKDDKLSESKFLDQGVVEELHTKPFNSDTENQIEEGLFKFYLEEKIKEWNECIERNCVESQIREEVYFTVLSESAKEAISSAQETSKADETDKTIREDIGKIVYKEMIGEYNMALEDYSTLMEYRVGAIRDNFVDHLQLVSIESLVREDICMIVLRCMLMEWKIELEDYYLENLIKEQLHQLIMIEIMKDKTMEQGVLSTMMLGQVHDVEGEEKSIKILLESLLNCFEAEEYLMMSARSEIKEHSRQLDLGSERGELHEHEIFEDLIIGEEQTFYSLTSKVEKALQQLGTSKVLLSELGTTLCVRLCSSEKNLDQTTIQEEEEEEKSMSDLSPLFNFLHTFTEFEGIVNQKLVIETVRLENMNYCLDLVAESIDCLRSKASAFQKAFKTRCQNLQKAELEVDLLGDQVDVLLTLLEKIYVTLYQHAPVLQQHFEVYNMLDLIKKQLANGAI